MATRAKGKLVIDPARGEKVYKALGRLTNEEKLWLTHCTAPRREQYLANIYGTQGGRHALGVLRKWARERGVILARGKWGR
jgi:hypothetical protein